MVLKWIGFQANSTHENEPARQRSRRVRRAAIKFERVRRNHMERVNKGLFLFLMGILALALLIVIITYH